MNVLVLTPDLRNSVFLYPWPFSHLTQSKRQRKLPDKDLRYHKTTGIIAYNIKKWKIFVLGCVLKIYIFGPSKKDNTEQHGTRIHTCRHTQISAHFISCFFISVKMCIYVSVSQNNSIFHTGFKHTSR